MSSELRTAKNAIEVIGFVKEHDLALTEDKQAIRGSFKVGFGENETIKMEVYSNRLTKGGKVAKQFETLQTILNGEVKTLANAKQDEKDEEGNVVKEGDTVAQVRIFGNGDFTPNFSEDIFKDTASGEGKTTVKNKLGFGTIKLDESLAPEDYKAEFEVEVFVKEVIAEVNKDTQEETGRAIIKGALPAYGGLVIPMTFVAGTILDEDGETEIDLGGAILDELEVGSTVTLIGSIVNQAIVTEIRKEGIGRAKIEKKTEYVNELQVFGAIPEEDETKQFTSELIREAEVQRQNKIDEKTKEEGKSKKKAGITGKPTGGAKAGTTKGNRPARRGF